MTHVDGEMLIGDRYLSFIFSQLVAGYKYLETRITYLVQLPHIIII
jgi:hypothetical protein